MGFQNERQSIRRRGLLAGIAGVMSATTGCSRLDIPTDGDQKTNHVSLCGCEIANSDEETHTFYVMIERDEEIIHWSKNTLDPNRIKSIDIGDWRNEPAKYVVSGSFDDMGQWARRDLTTIETIKCVLPSIEIAEDGRIRVLGLL